LPMAGGSVNYLGNTIPGRVRFQTGSDDQRLTLPVVDGAPSNTGTDGNGNTSGASGSPGDSASSDIKAGVHAGNAEADGGISSKSPVSAADGKSVNPDTPGLPMTGGPGAMASAMKLLAGLVTLIIGAVMLIHARHVRRGVSWRRSSDGCALAQMAVETGTSSASRRAVMHKLSLQAKGRELSRFAADASSGRAADTIFWGHDKRLRQTVFALRAGAEMSMNESPDEASLIVISGHIWLIGDETKWFGREWSYLIVEPGSFRIQADTNASMVLTVATKD